MRVRRCVRWHDGPPQLWPEADDEVDALDGPAWIVNICNRTHGFGWHRIGPQHEFEVTVRRVAQGEDAHLRRAHGGDRFASSQATPTWWPTSYGVVPAPGSRRSSAACSAPCGSDPRIQRAMPLRSGSSFHA